MSDNSNEDKSLLLDYVQYTSNKLANYDEFAKELGKNGINVPSTFTQDYGDGTVEELMKSAIETHVDKGFGYDVLASTLQPFIKLLNTYSIDEVGVRFCNQLSLFISHFYYVCFVKKWVTPGYDTSKNTEKLGDAFAKMIITQTTDIMGPSLTNVLIYFVGISVHPKLGDGLTSATYSMVIYKNVLHSVEQYTIKEKNIGTSVTTNNFLKITADLPNVEDINKKIDIPISDTRVEEILKFDTKTKGNFWTTHVQETFIGYESLLINDQYNYSTFTDDFFLGTMYQEVYNNESTPILQTMKGKYPHSEKSKQDVANITNVSSAKYGPTNILRGVNAQNKGSSKPEKLIMLQSTGDMIKKVFFEKMQKSTDKATMFDSLRIVDIFSVQNDKDIILSVANSVVLPKINGGAGFTFGIKPITTPTTQTPTTPTTSTIISTINVNTTSSNDPTVSKNNVATTTNTNTTTATITTTATSTTVATTITAPITATNTGTLTAIDTGVTPSTDPDTITENPDNPTTATKIVSAQDEISFDYKTIFDFKSLKKIKENTKTVVFNEDFFDSYTQKIYAFLTKIFGGLNNKEESQNGITNLWLHGIGFLFRYIAGTKDVILLDKKVIQKSVTDTIDDYTKQDLSPTQKTKNLSFLYHSKLTDIIHSKDLNVSDQRNRIYGTKSLDLIIRAKNNEKIYTGYLFTKQYMNYYAKHINIDQDVTYMNFMKKIDSEITTYETKQDEIIREINNIISSQNTTSLEESTYIKNQYENYRYISKEAEQLYYSCFIFILKEKNLVDDSTIYSFDESFDMIEEKIMKSFHNISDTSQGGVTKNQKRMIYLGFLCFILFGFAINYQLPYSLQKAVYLLNGYIIPTINNPQNGFKIIRQNLVKDEHLSAKEIPRSQIVQEWANNLNEKYKNQVQQFGGNNYMEKLETFITESLTLYDIIEKLYGNIQTYTLINFKNQYDTMINKVENAQKKSFQMFLHSIKNKNVTQKPKLTATNANTTTVAATTNTTNPATTNPTTTTKTTTATQSVSVTPKGYFDYKDIFDFKYMDRPNKSGVQISNKLNTTNFDSYIQTINNFVDTLYNNKDPNALNIPVIASTFLHGIRLLFHYIADIPNTLILDNDIIQNIVKKTIFDYTNQDFVSSKERIDVLYTLNVKIETNNFEKGAVYKCGDVDTVIDAKKDETHLIGDLLTHLYLLYYAEILRIDKTLTYILFMQELDKEIKKNTIKSTQTIKTIKELIIINSQISPEKYTLVWDQYDLYRQVEIQARDIFYSCFLYKLKNKNIGDKDFQQFRLVTTIYHIETILMSSVHYVSKNGDKTDKDVIEKIQKKAIYLGFLCFIVFEFTTNYKSLYSLQRAELFLKGTIQPVFTGLLYIYRKVNVGDAVDSKYITSAPQPINYKKTLEYMKTLDESYRERAKITNNNKYKNDTEEFIQGNASLNYILYQLYGNISTNEGINDFEDSYQSITEYVKKQQEFAFKKIKLGTQNNTNTNKQSSIPKVGTSILQPTPGQTQTQKPTLPAQSAGKSTSPPDSKKSTPTKPPATTLKPPPTADSAKKLTSTTPPTKTPLNPSTSPKKPLNSNQTPSTPKSPSKSTLRSIYQYPDIDEIFYDIDKSEPINFDNISDEDMPSNKRELNLMEEGVVQTNYIENDSTKQEYTPLSQSFSFDTGTKLQEAFDIRRPSIYGLFSGEEGTSEVYDYFEKCDKNEMSVIKIYLERLAVDQTTGNNADVQIRIHLFSLRKEGIKLRDDTNGYNQKIIEDREFFKFHASLHFFKNDNCYVTDYKSYYWGYDNQYSDKLDLYTDFMDDNKRIFLMTNYNNSDYLGVKRDMSQILNSYGNDTLHNFVERQNQIAYTKKYKEKRFIEKDETDILNEIIYIDERKESIHDIIDFNDTYSMSAFKYDSEVNYPEGKEFIFKRDKFYVDTTKPKSSHSFLLVSDHFIKKLLQSNRHVMDMVRGNNGVKLISDYITLGGRTIDPDDLYKNDNVTYVINLKVV